MSSGEPEREDEAALAELHRLRASIDNLDAALVHVLDEL